MRCANCGFPLSPSRTTCPKCGAAVNLKASAPQGPGAPAQQWGNGGAFTPTMAPPADNSGPASFQNVHTPMPARFDSPPSAQPMAPPGFRQPTRLFVRPPQRGSNQLNPRRNFTLAFLCLGTSALILLLVLFLTQSLRVGGGGQTTNTNNTTIQGSSSPQATTFADAQTPAVSASPSVTQTPYPGQQYISDAQTSDSSGGSALTTFKSGQKIYVTFSIHSNSRGAYCLLWYLNSKTVSHFENPANAGSAHSSSWAVIYGTGSAYVELYWASSAACTDKVLAQHVDFTVGP